MVGRIDGTVNGRPTSIKADGECVTLQLSGLTTAWALRKCAPHLRLLMSWIDQGNLRLRVQLPGFAAFQLLPSTSIVARLLLGWKGRG
jgi:hypothetical protein